MQKNKAVLPQTADAAAEESLASLNGAAFDSVQAEESAAVQSADGAVRIYETEAADISGANRESEAESQKPKTKASFKQLCSKYFTATRIAYIAVFTALSFILRLPWFEFYIIPAVPFLKIDFSGVFALIAGLSLGPVAGIVVSVIKEFLYALSFTQTIGVGEVANIIIMLPYLLIPAIVYKKRKGIKTVLVALAIGCACQVVWSIPVNYLLTFPFYLNLYMGTPWASGMEYYLSLWYWAVLFNFVKTVLLTAAVLILYKPLSRLIKLTNAKFTSMKKKRG
ncbi:MAG: ECF transporter S component [Clostridia bacterium]|nr:ECF transporter S component [Clostridia bacterium]